LNGLDERLDWDFAKQTIAARATDIRFLNDLHRRDHGGVCTAVIYNGFFVDKMVFSVKMKATRANGSRDRNE
jgi:hypothetical protein